MSPVPWGFQHKFMGFLRRYMGKCSFFQVKLGMWPLKSIVSEKRALFCRVSTHIYGVSKEIYGKTFIFKVNLGMLPLKLNFLRKNESYSEGYNTHLWGFSGDIYENIHFSCKARHLAPQINCFRKMSLFCRFQHTFMEFLRRYMGKHSFLK